MALGCGLMAAGVLACSGDDPSPTADITADLTILKDQQGFTEGEVRCVADHAQEELSGAAVERFVDDVAELSRTRSLTSMSAESQATLTRAITACAGG